MQLSRKSLLILPLLLPAVAPAPAAAQTAADAMFTVNNVWMMVATFLVFIMHLGFSTLEIGLTQSKNTVNKADINVVKASHWKAHGSSKAILHLEMRGTHYLAIFEGGSGLGKRVRNDRVIHELGLRLKHFSLRFDILRT